MNQNSSPYFNSSENNETSFADQNIQEFDLKEIYKIFRRRKKVILSVFAGVFLLSISYNLSQRILNPIYKGSFTLLIKDPMDQGNKRVANQELRIFEELASNTTDNDVPTLIELLRSTLIIEPVANEFNLNPTKLRKRIEIKEAKLDSKSRRFQKADGILNVFLYTKKPKKEIKLLEALSKKYLNTALQERQQRLNDGLSFLNKQEPILQEKVIKLQSKLVEFREKNNLLEPEIQGTSLKNQEQLIEDQIRVLNTQKNQLKDIKNGILNSTITARGFKDAIGTNNDNGTGLVINDFDQSLLEQLLITEKELAIAKSRFTSNSKIVLGLEKRLDQIKPLLIDSQLEAVNTALNLNESKVNETNKQKEKIQVKFRQNPKLIKEINSLRQQLSIANSNLKGLVSARENFQLKLAQSNLPWRIIEPPRMQNWPFKPSVGKGLGISFIAAFLGGIFAGFIREKTDQVFHSPDEVVDILNKPLLGDIPFTKEFSKRERIYLTPDENDDIETKKARFFYQEAFRNLFTSLRFLNSDEKINCFNITSSTSSEGKSFVNTMLSKTLSELGHKVLLIDGDMRKPQVHNRLGLNNLRGLSNILSESDSNWEDYLISLPDQENLSIITAGIKPPDPPSLLSSKRMSLLVNEIKESKKFDYIIIDSPPIIGLSDAMLISENTDGIILLVSINQIEKSFAKSSVQRISDSPTKLLGLVTNNRKEFNYKSGDPYGGYGYGYGYNAYNPAVAYSQYGDKNSDELSETGNEKNKPKFNKLEKIKSIFSIKMREFKNWIDS